MTAGYCRLYEQPAVQQATGPTLRPGGLDLTRRLLTRCELPARARVLDVGCGAGATLSCLAAEFNLNPTGLDPSGLLLAQAKAAALPLTRSPGERLPFAAGQFQAVLAECSLSLMRDPAAALVELARVLQPGGRLILSDLYARNPAAIPALRGLPLDSCLRGAMSQAEIIDGLVRAGFAVLDWEDYSPALKYFAGQLIFAHGSLAAFWGCATQQQANPAAIAQAINLARPGYYAAIGIKKM